MTLRAPKPGDMIRASWLNDLVAEVNRLRSDVNALQGWTSASMGNAGAYQSAGWARVGGGSLPTGLTFTETSRGYATRTVTDSASDTFTFQVATSITMTATTYGLTWTFRYSAPT